MQDEGISRPPARLPGFAKLGIGIAACVLLYYGVMAGVRFYVTSRIHEQEGRAMPTFELRDRTGRLWTLADLRGKKTVLNFFRSQCVNCRRERDVIRRLATEAAENDALQVVGVMTDEIQGFDAAMTAATLAEFGYRHPILMADKAFADALHGAGWSHVTPVTYIVDAKGTIVRAFRGHQTLETLRAATR